MLKLRCVGHEQHGNIFNPGERIQIEVWGSRHHRVRLKLEQRGASTKIRKTIHQLERIKLTANRQVISIEIPTSIAAGYYHLVGEDSSEKYTTFIFINSTGKYDIAIIYPLFTIWSYHADGFYPNHDNRFFEKCALKLGPTAIKLALRFGIQAKPEFPNHARIHLNEFYRTNRRWEKTRAAIMPDSTLEGLWFDELFVLQPILIWLQEIDVKVRFFCDLDLHLWNSDLRSSKTTIFVGHEGFTASGMSFVQKMINANQSCLFLGSQALGCREYKYDKDSGCLEYKATRGRIGLWGDRLENDEPVWAPEGDIFGFQFPVPIDENWRYQQVMKKWRILDLDMPFFRGLNLSSYEHTVKIGNDEYPILTYVGGEYLERHLPEAQVLACLDDEQNIIGCGRYKNCIFFSPTYWPFIGMAQREKQPEIFGILTNTINWMLQEENLH